MASFTYQPFTNPLGFRLLKAELEQNGQYHCSLEEHILSDDELPKIPPPKYTALSYTWGDHASWTEIICNGKKMKITSKLCEALRGVASLNPHEYLWVDQICINQADLVEKQQQVSRMTKIYDLAITVLAWLGPPRDDTRLGIEWIERVSGLTKGFGNDIFRDYENHDERMKVETQEDLTLEQSESLGVSFANDAAWTAFSAFYDSPWFQRMWIIQELLPAREAKLVRGSHCVDWHAVKAAAAWYMYKTGLIRESYDKTRKVHGVWLAYQMNLSWNIRHGAEFTWVIMNQKVRPTYRWLLPHLISTFYHRAATDPRDKVFALLGISEVDSMAQTNPLLQPNYTKPVRNVYRDMIRGYLQAASGFAGTLNILWTALPHSDDPTWPSWAPDFRRDEAPVGYSRTLPAHDPAGWQNKALYHEPPDDDCLALEGHIVGHVIYRSEWECTLDLHLNIRSVRDEVLDLYRERFGSTTYLPSPADKEENVNTAFTMSLTGGKLWSGFEKASTSSETLAHHYVFLIETVDMPGSTEEERALREERLQTLRALGFSWTTPSDWGGWTHDKYCGRRLFVTDTGYVGIGKRELNIGDAVTVLWGLDRACILRPLTEDAERREYSFVGEAYCRHADEAVKRLPREGDHSQGEIILLR